MAVLYKANPSMFRNRPVWFLIWVAVMVIPLFTTEKWVSVLGIAVLALWRLRAMNQTLILDEQSTTLRSGILAKSISEVRHKDVRNVKLHQTFGQRLTRVGEIGISSSGQGDLEISIAGIPRPDKVKSIIDQHRA